MQNAASARRALDADTCLLLARALLRLGVRQVALLRATSASIAFAPTIDDCAGCIERAREVLLQLERSAELYLEHTSASLLHDAEQLLGELPRLASWAEAALAQLVLSLATQLELERADLQHGEPRALASATEHLHAARAALLEAGALSHARAASEANSARWLTIALGTLEDEARCAYERALERHLDPESLAFRP